MSGESNTLRKTRVNRKAVERVIPITLTDANSNQGTPEASKQSETKQSLENKVRSSTVDAEDNERERTPKKPETKTLSLKTESKKQSSAKATSSSTNSSSLQENGDSSEGSEICTSVKELTLTSTNDNDEEKIKEECISKFKMPQQLLPPYNVPEKIIIVLDRARDEIFTNFELNGDYKFDPLSMLKQGLYFLMNNKSTFDSKHEYALMVLNENSATWVHDFTSDIDSIIGKFDDIDECETEDIFNMNSVFDIINSKISIPSVKSNLIIPPPFIVRTIFTYGRSFTMPQIEMTDEISNLLDSPYFTFDVLMTHETPDASNKCGMIFKKLQDLDSKGFAYFFPVSRSSMELHQAVAKLLSHPLQRPIQKMANYKLSNLMYH